MASNGQQWPAMDGAGSEGGLEIFDKAAGGTRGHWQTVGAVALSDEPSQHQDHGDHAGAAGAVSATGAAGAATGAGVDSAGAVAVGAAGAGALLGSPVACDIPAGRK